MEPGVFIVRWKGRFNSLPGTSFVARNATPTVCRPAFTGMRGVERPLRFRMRGRLYEVMQIEDRWFSPGAMYFRVRADDDNFYVLRYDEGQDVWGLYAFRAAERGAE